MQFQTGDGAEKEREGHVDVIYIQSARAHARVRVFSLLLFFFFALHFSLFCSLGVVWCGGVCVRGAAPTPTGRETAGEETGEEKKKKKKKQQQQQHQRKKEWKGNGKEMDRADETEGSREAGV